MLLIIDIECTCEENTINFNYEIIEIGAVWLDEFGNITNEFQAFVKPLLNSELTLFCKQLTNIQQEDVASADSFAIVAKQLHDFSKLYSNGIWGSWGSSDLKQIEIESERHGIQNPLLEMQHRNLKKEFAKLRKIKQVGVKKALELLKIDNSVNLHRALEDARKIAALVHCDTKS